MNIKKSSLSREPKWLKIMSNKFLVRIVYPVIVFIIICLAIYFLGQIGGYNNCPNGQHEEQGYGRFGGNECVFD